MRSVIEVSRANTVANRYHAIFSYIGMAVRSVRIASAEHNRTITIIVLVMLGIQYYPLAYITNMTKAVMMIARLWSALAMLTEGTDTMKLLMA